MEIGSGKIHGSEDRMGESMGDAFHPGGENKATEKRTEMVEKSRQPVPPDVLRS